MTQPVHDVDLQQGTIAAAALSSDGSLVAMSLKYSGAVSLCETATGHLIARKSLAHASPISSLAFSPDGSELATADRQGTIKLWGELRKIAENSEPRRIFKGHTSAVANVSFSSEKELVSVGTDKAVRIWDPQSEVSGVRRLASSSAATTATFSPDGLLVAIAENGRVRLCDASSGELVRELMANKDGRVTRLAFSPDGRLLAVGHSGGNDHSHISLCEVDSGVRLARLPGATELAGFPDYRDFASVTAVAFSPDGKWLVAGFGSPNVYSRQRFASPLKVWDVQTRQLVRSLPGHTAPCTSIDFSRDATLLASGSYDGTAIVWSTATWKPLQTLENPDRETATNWRIVADVAFSPDGRTLAMASREGSVVIWDLATGQTVTTLSGHSSAVTAVAFSPDGRTLASGGDDQTIRLWNAATWRELVALESAAALSHVNQLAFSCDGSRLLAAAPQACIWSASPPVWDDPRRAAEKLERMLDSGIDFARHVRMFSENLRLHEALERVVSDDPRVAAALAAARANRHAARRQWPEAADEFQRLKQLGAGETEWLRTPGLVRIARALVERGEFVDAAACLTDALKRRIEDAAGAETDDLLATLHAATEERLAADPQNVALLELRATMAGQRSDHDAQVRDYTAAIDALESLAAPDAPTEDIKRLYRRRGDAYLALQAWRKAADDYTHGWTDTATKDELSNRALAEAEVMLKDMIDPLVSTSEAEGVPWRFTTDASNERWNQTDFDDSAWQEGLAPFGHKYAAVRTAWTTGDIWLRHTFEGPAGDKAIALFVRLNVDDSAEVFLNGQRLLSQDSWTVTQYVLHVLPGVTSGIVKSGTNTLAVHCRNVVVPAGFVDVGLFATSQNPPAWEKFLAAKAITGSWARLAAAYRMTNSQQVFDDLADRYPQATRAIADSFAADNDWKHAIAMYAKADAVQNPDLSAKRAWAYEQLRDWTAAAADWARVAEHSPSATEVLTDFARRLWQHGEPAMAASHYERVQRMYEEDLRADPENNVAAEALAGLLLDSRRINEKWTVLKPVEMKSKLGTTLTFQPDGSILTDGSTRSKESNTVSCRSGVTRIAALRLEALPHPTLRDSGPGWGLRGNFHLTELRAKISRASQAALGLKFRSAIADYTGSAAGGANAGDGPHGAIDGNQETYWDVWPDSGQPHRLILVLSEPIDVADDDRITVELDFFDPLWPRARLGCFRLSVASDPDVYDQDVRLAAAMKIRDPWMRLAAAYAWHGQADQAMLVSERALDGARSMMAKVQILDDAAGQEDLLAALAQRRPNDPQIQLVWAKCLVDRGIRRLESGLTSEGFQPEGTARSSDRFANSERDLVDAQALFARLRNEYPQPHWTVLKPLKLKSLGGAALTELDDASILVSGPNPAKDVYEIEVRLDNGPYTAIRVEGLPHESLPGGGPGRSGQGQALLSEFELEAASSADDDAWQDVRIELAWAGREQTGYTVDRAVDGQEATGWVATGDASRDPRTAIFIAQRPFGAPSGTRLRIRLRHENEVWSHHQFGRFRLAATAAPHVIQPTVLDQANQKVLDALLALGKVYAQADRPDDAMRAFAEAVKMATDRGAKASIVKAAASLAGMLDKMTAIAPDDAQIAAELAKHYANHGEPVLAAAARRTARELYERQLKTTSPHSQLARQIAGELGEILFPEAEASLSLEGCPWVWFAGDGEAPPTARRYFRGAINVDRPVVRARMVITADNNFVLYVNGKDVARGNGAEEGWTDVQTAVLTGLLTPGRNLIAIDAVNFPPKGSKNPAGVIGRYEVVYADGAMMTGAIDETWKSNDKRVDGWREAEFDDSGWTTAVKLADYGQGAWGNFQRRLKSVAKAGDPWAKLAAAYRIGGDISSSDELFEQHTEAVLIAAESFADDGRWQWAIELYSKAIELSGQASRKESNDERAQHPTRPDVELLAKRARAYERLADWKAAAADWQRAAEHRRQGANLLGEFARRLGEHGQAGLASDYYERSRQLYEQDLRADPKNLVAAQALTDALLHAQQDHGSWTLLRPLEAKSQAGVTLTLEEDGSVLSSGEALSADTYTVTAAGNLAKVAAIRLEALPHSGLPAEGPGWQGGNFHLTEFRASLRKPDEATLPLTFRTAVADYNRSPDGDARSDDGAAAAIDGNQQTRWDVWPLVAKPHWLIAILPEPIDLASNDRIVVELDFRDARWPLARLGCFRLSATGQMAACEQAAVINEASKVSDPWLRLATAYALHGNTEEATRRFAVALKQADRLETRRTIMELAARDQGVLTALGQEHADDPLLRLAVAGHHMKRGTSSLATRPAEAQAEFDQSRAMFERLLSKYKTDWQVVQPTKMVSAGGATLSLLADGSVLASGKNPDKDTYTIHVRPDLPRVTAVRLEALPDDSLPHLGSGRSELNGNINLTGITFGRAASGTADSEAIDIRAGWVDHSDPDSGGAKDGVEGMLDASDQTHWSVHPLAWRAHLAIFELDQAVDFEGGEELTIQIHFQNKAHKQHALGRFRLSVTSDAETITTAVLHSTHAVLGQEYATLGHWQRATAGYQSAMTLNPNDCFTWLRAAPVFALAGDEAVYREFCRKMLQQFRDAEGPTTAERICKSCLLRSGAADLAELPLQELRDATSAASQAGARPWFWATSALAAYRAGNSQDAMHSAEQVDKKNTQATAMTLAVCAMAEHDLGHTEEARQTLATACALIPAELQTLGTDAYGGPLPVATETISHDWLIPEILRREASERVAGGPPR